MLADWNLTHLYKDEDLYLQDYNDVVEKLSILNKQLPLILNSKHDFKLFLVNKFKIEETIQKLYCYNKRHLDIDRTIQKYSIMLEKVLNLFNEYQEINISFEQTIISNHNTVEKYLNDKSFSKYIRYIQLILRRKDHMVNQREIAYYQNISNNIQIIKTSYQNLFNSDITFKDVELNNKMVEINRTNYNQLMLDSKQENRKKIFNTYTTAYIKAIDILSKLYIDKLTCDITLAQLENYSDLLEKKMFELELSKDIIKNLIKTVNNHLYVMHRYTELKKKVSGLENYHIYDATVSLCEIPNINYDFTEAINMAKNSLKILGENYIDIVDKMLVEGWIDVYPKKYKRTMSFTCISYVGVPYILINYDQSMNSVRTLAHEIGHSIHTYYSKINNNFCDYEFSYFLTEIASKVNEILINEYMLKTCNSKEEKIYILNNIISSFGNSIFGQVMLTEFEHLVITKLSNSITINIEYLNNLYLELSKKYNGPALEYDDNIKYGWAKIPHFFMQDTYYLYQYSIGNGIAADIAYRILKKEKNIVSKYKKFLSLGNSVPIKDALMILNIDLNKETYMENIIMILNQKIEELEKLLS